MIIRYGEKGKCWSSYLDCCLRNKTITFDHSLDLSRTKQNNFERLSRSRDFSKEPLSPGRLTMMCLWMRTSFLHFHQLLKPQHCHLSLRPGHKHNLNQALEFTSSNQHRVLSSTPQLCPILVSPTTYKEFNADHNWLVHKKLLGALSRRNALQAYHCSQLISVHRRFS